MGTFQQRRTDGLETSPGGPSWAPIVAKASGALVALVGAGVFAGWTLDIPSPRAFYPTLFAMKANTAMGLLLAGVALWLEAGAAGRVGAVRVGKASGYVVALLGLLTLTEYVLGGNLGIDEVLLRDTVGGVDRDHPGRMAANTALAFTLVGIGLVAGRSKRAQGVRDTAFLAATLIGIGALIGYLYGVASLYGLAVHTRMAPHAAASFVALGMGALCLRPDRGLGGILFGDGMGGQVGRRLLPAAILVPIGLGWLRIQGERAGIYGGDFGVSLFVVATMVLLCAAIFWSLKVIERADRGRRSAETALQTYADLAKNTPVGFIVWRLGSIDDARTFTLMACNPAGDRILGFGLAAHIGEPMVDLFPALANTPRLEQYADVVRLDQGRDFGEVRGTSATTSAHLYNVTAFPLPDQSLGVSFEDITARKAAELDLRREKEAVQAANKELEAFSYSVSHDLRAPLRGIDGFSQALIEDYAGKLDDEGQQHLRRIRAGAQKMGHLIDDLIKLSRVTRAEIQRTEVDLSRIAREVADDLHRDDPGRHVDIIIQDGLVAQGDPTLLRVALDNLIGNAWKFTSKRAEGRIEFGVSDAVDGHAAYFVRDNGAGFDMTYAQKLFGAFQRLHAMDEFPGTGIGLATVQRVVRRHGGKVWAEGEVGKGAAFSFTL